MFITVAICTWNRASLLDKTLAQFANLRIPVGVEWKLIVVNNNCTDSTSLVIDKYRDALPLEELIESKQGHSHSRNCAVTAASGDYLVWTDDDVLVEPDWLEEYAKAFLAFPQATCFGGPSLPWFESPPTGWIAKHFRELHVVYAITDHAKDRDAHLTENSPFGANMAFQLDALKQTVFNTSLGRDKGDLISGDEMAVFDQMRLVGKEFVWVGKAKVLHFVPEERMTLQYVKSWYRGQGQTKVRMGDRYTRKCIAGIPRWAFRGFAQNRAVEFATQFSRGKRWLKSMRSAATYYGLILEHRRQWHANSGSTSLTSTQLPRD